MITACNATLAMKRKAQAAASASGAANKRHVDERAAALRAQVEELARKRNEEEPLGRGSSSGMPLGRGSSGSGTGMPEHDGGMRLPMLISSTEMGVYIKWSLLLQEQLQKATEQHRQISDIVERLREENKMLRHAIETGETTDIPLAASSAHCTGGLSFGSTSGTTASAPSTTGGSSSCSSPAPPGIVTAGDIGAFRMLSDGAKSLSNEDELLECLLSTPSLDNGLLSTPNLASLTATLDSQPNKANVAWKATDRKTSGASNLFVGANV